MSPWRVLGWLLVICVVVWMLMMGAVLGNAFMQGWKEGRSGHHTSEYSQ